MAPPLAPALAQQRLGDLRRGEAHVERGADVHAPGRPGPVLPPGPAGGTPGAAPRCRPSRTRWPIVIASRMLREPLSSPAWCTRVQARVRGHLENPNEQPEGEGLISRQPYPGHPVRGVSGGQLPGAPGAVHLAPPGVVKKYLALDAISCPPFSQPAQHSRQRHFQERASKLLDLPSHGTHDPFRPVGALSGAHLPPGHGRSCRSCCQNVATTSTFTQSMVTSIHAIDGLPSIGYSLSSRAG